MCHLKEPKRRDGQAPPEGRCEPVLAPERPCVNDPAELSVTDCKSESDGLKGNRQLPHRWKPAS